MATSLVHLRVSSSLDKFGSWAKCMALDNFSNNFYSYFYFFTSSPTLRSSNLSAKLERKCPDGIIAWKLGGGWGDLGQYIELPDGPTWSSQRCKLPI